MQKVFFTGTHRVRPPEETYEAIRPLLRDFGITRLADVTGLDIIGIPVVMAVRPLGTTLSVAQGKGATLLLAKVSGAMEAIEFWHAENAVPAPELFDTPASEIDLPYGIADLAGALEVVRAARAQVQVVVGVLLGVDLAGAQDHVAGAALLLLVG